MASVRVSSGPALNLLSDQFEVIHRLHLMLLRSKIHLLLNLLLKLLIQEIFTPAHQYPTHNHIIFTLMGTPFNRCPLVSIWTHLPYGAFIISYNSLASKYGNWHHLQIVQRLLLLDGFLKRSLTSLVSFEV